MPKTNFCRGQRPLLSQALVKLGNQPSSVDFHIRAVVCQKLISVEGNGRCCHRPSSKLGNQSSVVICLKQISVEGNGHCCHRPSSNWETNHQALISTLEL